MVVEQERGYWLLVSERVFDGRCQFWWVMDRESFRLGDGYGQRWGFMLWERAQAKLDEVAPVREPSAGSSSIGGPYITAWFAKCGDIERVVDTCYPRDAADELALDARIEGSVIEVHVSGGDGHCYAWRYDINTDGVDIASAREVSP